MLLYLNRLTWTRGSESDALGTDVLRAMDLGVHVLLVHEMPGQGGQSERGACEFGDFFSCAQGATPQKLLQRDVYSEIAIALKGGTWRATSMAMLAAVLSVNSDETESAAGMLREGLGNGALQKILAGELSISKRVKKALDTPFGKKIKRLRKGLASLRQAANSGFEGIRRRQVGSEARHVPAAVQMSCSHSVEVDID